MTLPTWISGCPGNPAEHWHYWWGPKACQWEPCKHLRTTSTLMWPPEANSTRCEDCGEVLQRPFENQPERPDLVRIENSAGEVLHRIPPDPVRPPGQVQVADGWRLVVRPSPEHFASGEVAPSFHMERIEEDR